VHTGHTPAMPAATRTKTAIDLRLLRPVAALMLGAAIVRPMIPHQPGLPCPLRTFTGVPCPMCGMTRSVTSVVHFDWVASLRYSPGGVFLVLFAVGLLATWLAGWRPQRICIPAWVLPAILGVLWSYQLFKYATGRPL
jgi:Protein of unknown function (DUF2752)